MDNVCVFLCYAVLCMWRHCDWVIARLRSHTKCLKQFIVSEVNSELEPEATEDAEENK
jgi:hypothetical protein